MNELVASFEKQFRGGARIQAALRSPAEGFSVTVLFGPSGSGKTTILRCLAGLEVPEQGSIQFAGQTWFDSGTRTNLPPQGRGVGYLFQQYALFPHRTVAQNIAYGIVGERAAAQARVATLIEQFELTGLQNRFPKELSGGQQQRVALARAIACQPKLLLLDEPLSALDQTLRQNVRSQLRRWLKQCAAPTVMVTHDRDDAMALGDRIVILDGGQILQQGPLAEVFAHPSNETVAKIVGVETIVAGRIVGRQDGVAQIAVNAAILWAAASDHSTDRVLVCIRGEDVVLNRSAENAGSIRNRLRGKVVSISLEGALARVTVDCGLMLAATITRPACEELELRAGAEVYALIKATAIHVVPD
ncbi:MAG TPA: ABC transporter ATP-binding protein [Pirellulales bacterium]|jgi:molybdate transport system ATP-binding protein